MDENIILKFKGAVVTKKTTITQFALDHHFNPAVFSMAINGHTATKPEYEKAIIQYIEPETRLYMLTDKMETKERLGGELKKLVIGRLFPESVGKLNLHRTDNSLAYEWLCGIAEQEALGTNLRRDVMKITDVLDEFDNVQLVLE